ncbi:MAG: hypothetical protein ACRDZ3_06005 [Acidimicrobiia bacterium]
MTAAGALLAAGVAAGIATGGAETKDREVKAATRVTAPVRDWDAECDNDGDHGNAPAADLPWELRFFPTYVPDGLTVGHAGASVWPDHLGCHHGSVALILAEMDRVASDRVLRTIQVSGPSYRERQAGGNDLMIEEAVSVRGDRGVWQTHKDAPSVWGVLYWTDSEGGGWTLHGARARAEAIAVANALHIDLDSAGPPVVLADPPKPLEVLWERPEPEGAGLEEEWSWGVTLVDPKQTSEGPMMAPPTAEPAPDGKAEAPAPPTSAPYAGPAVSISVQRMATATTAFTNASSSSRLIEIRGRRGLEQANPDRTALITWDEALGIQVTISGSAGVGELRKVAESLELVDADDPHLITFER